MASIPVKLVEDTARELMARAAIDIPEDYREGVRLARDREGNRLARFVLEQMLGNWEIATAERRPMCADTGLPRYYVRLGNEAVRRGRVRGAGAGAAAGDGGRDGGDPAAAQSGASAHAGGSRTTTSAMHAPEVTYAVEPGADWIDVTTVHKGGLFGSDYRMLFPGDGIGRHQALLRRHADRVAASAASPASPPSWASASAGAKDTCVRLGKEAACLRTVGSRNPDPAAAELEEELTALGNYIGIGAMGFAGTSMVVATHVELAYTHTGGMPIGIHQFCLSSRRATARIHPDGRVEFRERPGLVHRLLPARGHRVMARRSSGSTTWRWTRCTSPRRCRDAAIRCAQAGRRRLPERRALHRARGRLPPGAWTRACAFPDGGARADQRELPLLARRQPRARTAPTWSRR